MLTNPLNPPYQGDLPIRLSSPDKGRLGGVCPSQKGKKILRHFVTPPLKRRTPIFTNYKSKHPYDCFSISFSCSHSNSQSFQSSNKRIINHTAMQIRLPINGLFGKKYSSNRFAIPHQTMTTAANIKKAFRFDLRSFLNFLTLFAIVCINFGISLFLI